MVVGLEYMLCVVAYWLVAYDFVLVLFVILEVVLDSVLLYLGVGLVLDVFDLI